MGYIVPLFERGGEDEYRFERGMKMIEEGSAIVRELTEKMKHQYGERGGYSERRGTAADRDGDGRYNERGDYSQRGGYGERDGGYDHYQERGRDSMGRYR